MILLHEISQTALAAAVLTLGLVLLLELRAIKRLRRSVDINLGRVFEQLEMLRAESRQLIDAPQQAVRMPPVVAPARPVLVARKLAEHATVERLSIEEVLLEGEVPEVAEAPVLQATVLPPASGDAYSNATRLAANGMQPEDIASLSGLPAGEARLLASLAAARARKEQAERAAREAQEIKAS